MAGRDLIPNADSKTIQGFGEEWTAFNQDSVPEAEIIFEQYFRIFPWQQLPAQPVGFDLGCGSGRWAKFVSSRVGTLHCIDASEAALRVAQRNLRDCSNCRFHHASVDAIPLDDATMDFGYSLGVLHHIPDTLQGIRGCVAKLKKGAPILLYLYYAFDNRPAWFRAVWRATDLLRRLISRLPLTARKTVTDGIALLVYWPMARFAATLERLRLNQLAKHMPLSAYRHHSFYTMRTDSLDRFGTRLERRFTATQIRTMMSQAGLEEIIISDSEPYWCAVGHKSR